MVDLLGPGDAGASPTLTTTSDVTSPAVGDTWFNDCPAGVSDASATPILSKWLNWQMQQLRKAIRFSGVPLSNSYDNMLSWAIQSGKANWASSAGGTANALTASVNNSPLEIEVGTLIFLQATANNTGATTFNLNSLGDDAVKDIGGNALVGGEIVSGNVVGFLRYPSTWRIITPPPISATQALIRAENPFTTTGVGAVIIGTNYKSEVGTSDANGLIEIGMTGTWDATYSGSFNDEQFWIATGLTQPYGRAGDSRWLGAVVGMTWVENPIPGVWQVIGLTTVGPVDVGVEEFVAVFKRIS